MCGGAAVIEATAAIAELGLPVRVLTRRRRRPRTCQGGKRVQARRHPARVERQDDRDHQHRRRRTACPRRRAALRARARRDARRRLRDAHRRDVRSRSATCTPAGSATTTRSPPRSTRAAQTSGELAWRFPLHPRYRRYIDSDFADMKNASELREGGAVLAAEFLREFTGDGAVGALRHRRARLLSQQRRPDYALDQGGTGYGVRLIVELAQRFASMNFDLEPRARAAPRHGSAVRAREGRAGRRGARPREALPVRARRRDGRARADGHDDPRGVRRRRHRHAGVRDRGRGADAHRLVGRDHRRRAPLARHAPDLLLRQRGAEAAVAPRPRVGQEARGVRADRAERRLRRRRDAHHRAPRRRRMGRRRRRRCSSRTPAPTSRRA